MDSTNDPPEPRHPRRSKLDPTNGIITGMIIGVFLWVPLLYAFWQSGMHAGGEATCNCCLSQIAFALWDYKERHGHYPPASLADKTGRPMHSWRVLLLEILDPNLYAQYRFDEPWNGPNNRKLVDQMPDYYCCTNDHYRSEHLTSYFMVVGPDVVSRPGVKATRADIRDDPAETALVVEVADAHVNWMEPRDLDARTLRLDDPTARKPLTVSSHDPGGPGIVFADFHGARIAGGNVSPTLLRALITRSGGETIDGRTLKKAWDFHP